MKLRIALSAFAATCSITGLALSACALPPGPVGNPAPPAAPAAAAEVTYEVDGSGAAQNISYGANGNVSQQTNATLPWSTAGPAESFGFYSLTVMNGAQGGTVTCRIKLGDQVLAENTSSGQYATAMCNGSS